MVHQNCTDANQPAGGDGLDERDESANTPIGSTDSQRARLFDVDGLIGIRRYYQMQGFFERIIITDVLVNSWRPATQKQHKVYIKKWAIFCGIRKIAPDLSNMLEFLYTLLNLSYSSLNTARSALSCIVLIDKIPVGRHPVVCCFLKGAFEQKPPAHNYYGIWDANQVLQFLKAFSPNRCSSLKELTYKLAKLLALVTIQRKQALLQLDISSEYLKKSKMNTSSFSVSM